MTHTDTAPVRDETYFDELCTQGELISKHTDDAQFALGDIAAEIETRYGKADVQEFARRIKRSRSSVYEYIKVVRYYPPDVRIFWLGSPVLSYSHLKRAMKAPTYAQAEQWLNAAIDGCWSVDELERAIISDETGEHLTKLATVDTMLYRAVLGLDELIGGLQCETDTQLRIVVYKVTTGKDNNHD